MKNSGKNKQKSSLAFNKKIKMHFLAHLNTFLESSLNALFTNVKKVLRGSFFILESYRSLKVKNSGKISKNQV